MSADPVTQLMTMSLKIVDRIMDADVHIVARVGLLFVIAIIVRWFWEDYNEYHNEKYREWKLRKPAENDKPDDLVYFKFMSGGVERGIGLSMNAGSIFVASMILSFSWWVFKQI